MFVSGLDRPWTDTPFMLQGFLVEDDEDVARLRKYCRYIYVDLARSIGEAYTLEHAMARKAATAAEGPKVVTAVRQQWQIDLDEENGKKKTKSKSRRGPTPEPAAPAPITRPQPIVRPRAAVAGRSNSLQWTVEITAEEEALLAVAPDSPKSEGRSRRRPGDGATPNFGLGWIRSLAGSVADSVGEWLNRPDVPKFEDLPPRARASALEPMPPKFVVYQETVSIADELPRARQVLDRSHAVLKRIVEEVQSNGVVHLEKAEEVVNELVDSMARNPNALIWLARLKDADRRAYSHSLQTGIYMVAIGLHLGLDRDELTNLSVAGMMLDVGKLRVPQHLLEKPGKLTEEEFAQVRCHVQHSLDILAESPSVHHKVIEAVARHHEREDGTGYPKGLRGEAIGLYGRMAGLADTFVALTNPRPYASTLTMHEALRQMYNWRGGQFHEPLVEQFVQAVGVFPVGSMVELSSGEVAVVIAHNRVRRLKPRVLLLTGPDKTPLRRPVPLDLLYAPAGADDEELTIVQALPAGAYGVDPREFYLQ